jgi:acyl homoserine lactone synthase
VDEEGRHQGSLRLLPTTGDTMLRDHFTEVFDGVVIESPVIWECTRFCVDSQASENLTPRGVQSVTMELLLGICETGLAAGAEQIVGVFDRRMIRIYQRGGWSPELVGENGTGRDRVYLGLWDISEASAASIRRASGLSGSVLETGKIARTVNSNVA